MQIEIITPEVKVFSGEAEAVLLPGIAGFFQLLNNHAPLISALKKGSIKVDLQNDFVEDEKTSKLIQSDSNPKVIHISINGGVVEMLNNKIIVLAE